MFLPDQRLSPATEASELCARVQPSQWPQIGTRMHTRRACRTERGKMNRRRMKLAAQWALLAMTLSLLSARTWGAAGPVELRVDNLKTPLGIDDARPSFSWQLEDEA